MSERKVLTKYYPPDFDPSQVKRVRGPKTTGPKVQTVRLMAPFSMKCTACGEYIYKGRKFNARKETPPGEQYLNIQIYRFYIRCTRCSAEITFKTDPKNMDYTCERGAMRNTEPWRKQDVVEETTEERLDRLEREEADEAEALDSMRELENKAIDARREEQIADALDAIRMRNATRERAEAAPLPAEPQVDPDAEDAADEQLAHEAFRKKRRLSEEPTNDFGAGATAENGVGTNLWTSAKKSRKKDRPKLIPGLVKKK